MILGLVCARHQSQGLPGKNIRPLLGKPLIEYAVEKAFASQCDEVMVCTDIPRSAWSMAVQRIERPEELCGPAVSKWAVWQHAQRETGAELVVDIDVTRPLTLVEDVDDTINVALIGHAQAMAIAPSDKHPAFDLLGASSHGTLSVYDGGEIVARQQLEAVYQHGGVYVVPANALRAGDGMWSYRWLGNPIPRERSFDIDDELDWRIVEALMAERLQVA